VPTARAGDNLTLEIKYDDKGVDPLKPKAPPINPIKNPIRKSNFDFRLTGT
jgi:hypothetical protein